MTLSPRQLCLLSLLQQAEDTGSGDIDAYDLDIQATQAGFFGLSTAQVQSTLRGMRQHAWVKSYRIFSNGETFWRITEAGSARLLQSP